MERGNCVVVTHTNDWESVIYYGGHTKVNGVLKEIRANAGYCKVTEKVNFQKSCLTGIRAVRMATESEEEMLHEKILDKLKVMDAGRIYELLPAEIIYQDVDDGIIECELQINKKYMELLYIGARGRFIANEESDDYAGLCEMFIWCMRNGFLSEEI